MLVTTAARTGFDLVAANAERRRTAHRRVDERHSVKVDAIESVVARHRGVRGLTQLRQTLALVDGGAESPYESLTRLLLVQNGFPDLQTQIVVYDERGRCSPASTWGGRSITLGSTSRAPTTGVVPRQRSWDIERFAKLPELGWIDVRLTSGILHNRPQSFLDRVSAALISRGCPKTW